MNPAMPMPLDSPTSTRSVLGLIGMLVLCYGIAAVGGLTTTPAIEGWYAQIQKPAWTPPNWVFGPVWTVLYGTLAIAGWRLIRHETSSTRTRLLALFGVHLALNAIWSPVFFALESPWIALIIIGAMLGTLMVLLKGLRRFDRPVAWLLVPYLLWISYASTLNAGVAVLNS